MPQDNHTPVDLGEEVDSLSDGARFIALFFENLPPEAVSWLVDG